MSFLKKCCKCFSGANADVHSPISNLNNHSQTELRQTQQEPAPKVIIDSKFKLEDIQFNEFTPSSTQKALFTYNCPICLRFFSTILILKCCKNYICHFCIDELSKTTKFEVACPLCKASPITATDVDLASTIKRYSDSPFSTLRQSTNNQGGNKWVPMSVVNEDLELEESHKVLSLDKSVVNSHEVLSMTRMHQTA